MILQSEKESVRRSINALISLGRWPEIVYDLADLYNIYPELVTEAVRDPNDRWKLSTACADEAGNRLCEIDRIVSYGSYWDPLELSKVIQIRSNVSMLLRILDEFGDGHSSNSLATMMIDDKIRAIAESRRNRSAFLSEYFRFVTIYPERRKLDWHREIEKSIES